MRATAHALRELVETTRSRLEEISEEQAAQQVDADRWTIKQIVGHLIDSAANNHQRFIRAQAEDPFYFPKYEQNAWVDRNHYQTASWKSLVGLWYFYNLHLSHVMEGIPEAKGATECRIGEYEPATLAWVVQDYLVHLQGHLDEIFGQTAR